MKDTKKLTLSKETLRTIHVASSIRAWRIKVDTNTCKCNLTVKDSIDACGDTVNSACKDTVTALTLGC